MNDILKNYDISDEEDDPKTKGKKSTLVTTVWGAFKWPFLVFVQKFAAGNKIIFVINIIFFFFYWNVFIINKILVFKINLKGSIKGSIFTLMTGIFFC